MFVPVVIGLTALKTVAVPTAAICAAKVAVVVGEIMTSVQPLVDRVRDHNNDEAE